MRHLSKQQYSRIIGIAAIAGAVGALSIGALAIGALAIGRLAIGRIAIGRAVFKSLHIEELTVARLGSSDLIGSKVGPFKSR